MKNVNKKPLARKSNSVQTKTRPRVNYEWIDKTVYKKSHPKNQKIVKIEVKLPHVNKKPLSIKRIFVPTPFSHSTVKSGQKILCLKTTHFLARLPVSA